MTNDTDDKNKQTETELEHLPEVWRERACGTEHPRVRNAFENFAKFVEMAVNPESTVTLQETLNWAKRAKSGCHDPGEEAAHRTIVSEIEGAT